MIIYSNHLMTSLRNRGVRVSKRRSIRSIKKHKRTYSGRSGGSSSGDSGLLGSLLGVSALTQGVELHSGSFQEQAQAQAQAQAQTQSELIMGGGKDCRSTNVCANDIAKHILSFLELLNTIKIYHWSTLSFATHKATDELHEKLSELVDSFIEIYIGHCSRRGSAGAGADAGADAGAGAGAGGVPIFRFKARQLPSIPFCDCKSLAAFCKVLDDNIVHLESLTKSLNGYTDLVNIRDEMVGALAQALYLLRLDSINKSH